MAEGFASPCSDPEIMDTECVKLLNRSVPPGGELASKHLVAESRPECFAELWTGDTFWFLEELNHFISRNNTLNQSQSAVLLQLSGFAEERRENVMSIKSLLCTSFIFCCVCQHLESGRRSFYLSLENRKTKVPIYALVVPAIQHCWHQNSWNETARLR